MPVHSDAFGQSMFLSAEIAAVFVLSAQNRVELEETRKIEMSRKEAAGLRSQPNNIQNL